MNKLLSKIFSLTTFLTLSLGVGLALSQPQEVVGAKAASSVTYTISAKNTFTTTGIAPVGSSATIVETFSTSKQITSGSSQTVTLTGYAGLKITKIILSMKSNASAGAGNLTYTIDGGASQTIIATSAFNTASWNGAWSTSYVPITKIVDITAGAASTVFKITGTTNSLFCESYTFEYSSLRTLSEIQVTNQPSKKAYFDGETFDPNGMVVTAIYSDAPSAIVTNLCIFSPNPLTVETTMVTVSYTEGVTRTATISEITITAIVLNNISIKTPASKTTFKFGETFSATGLVIDANYNNGTFEKSTGFNVTGADMLKLGKQHVTVTFEGKSLQYEITVTNNGAIIGNMVATDLFISEYIEGTSSNKALEIFNGTGQSVDLSIYKVNLYANGATSPTSSLQLTGTLANNQTIVIVNASAAAAFKVPGSIEHAVTFFGGDDALALLKNDVIIDAFGVVGTDPGSSWPVGSGSTENFTLTRKSTIYSPVTSWSASEWDVYPVDTSTYLGSHVSAAGGKTPLEQATAYANFVMTGIGQNAKDSCAFVVTTLNAEYGYMVEDSQLEFETNPDSLFVNARERLAYLQAWAGSGSSPRVDGLTLSGGTNSVVFISLIGLLGLSSILGYSFLKKKKQLD